jgi:hypothetical protein
MSGDGGSYREDEPVRSKSRGRIGRFILVATVAALAAGLPLDVAFAHEVREVGDLTFVVGWSGEPAYGGFGNEVQVIVTETQGERPVEDGELEAEVIFGEPESDTRTTVTLDPAFDTPNEYLGYIIPTRPGTYSFHVTGTVGGQDIDEMFTSGPETFDDIQNPADAEFPEQDPSRGEIAERLDRLDARVQEAAAPMEEDSGDPVALWISIGAAVLALIAIALAARRRA